jgi:cephalosporin hydroxylase
MTLAGIYATRANTPSDIHEHLPTLYRAVFDSNAQTVVELGVRSGNSTAALLAAVEQTGGHLWSVDIALPNWPTEFFTSEHSTLIIGDDVAVSEQLPQHIDVLFIDTSHHYEHTLAELRIYGPSATTILLHDTELEDPYQRPATDPRWPVKRAVEKWCAEAGRTWTNHENCYGLGIVHPKEA